MPNRVFISSTQRDLKEYREAVDRAIRKLGMTPVAMEDFTAVDLNAIELCRKQVEESDIFVGIYAYRYGYVPDVDIVKQPELQGISLTEMEYRWAKAKKIPIRAFIIDDLYSWPEEMKEPEFADKLKSFLDEVKKEKVVDFFTNPESLALAVTQSLVNDLQRISRERRQQRRLVFGSVITISLMILAVIITLLMTSNQSAIVQADRAATNAVILAANQTATATLWTNTPTPSSTPTRTPPPTLTSTATATPLDAEPARQGEIALAVAQHSSSDSWQQLRSFADIRIGHSISSDEEAYFISDLYNASFVVWAEPDGDVTHYRIYLTPRQPGFQPQQSYLRYIEKVWPQISINLPSTGDITTLVETIRGYQSMSLELYREAAGHFSNAISALTDPDNETASGLYFSLGLAHHYSGDYSSAVENYTLALDMTSEEAFRAQLYRNRALSNYQNNDLIQAMNDVNEAIALDPYSAVSYVYRGYIYAKNGRLDDAVSDFTRAIEIEPSMANAYLWRGKAYAQQQQRYNVAMEDFTSAVSLDNEFSNAYYERFAARFDKWEGAYRNYEYMSSAQQAEYDQEMSLIDADRERFQALDQRVSTGYVTLGDQMVQSEDYEAAKIYYRFAIEAVGWKVGEGNWWHTAIKYADLEVAAGNAEEAVLGENRNIIQPTELGVWTYTGQSGEVLILTLFSSWDNALSLSLNGRLIRFTTEYSGTESRIQLSLPSNGTYIIAVTGYSRNDGGSYTLQIESVMPNPVNVGVNTGEIPPDSVEVWTYDGQAGEILTLTADAAWDTTLSLRLNGEEITFNNDDDDDSGSNSRIQHILPSDGTYEIVVDGYWSYDKGSYTLIVESSIHLTSTPSVTVTVQPPTETPAPTAIPTSAPTSIPSQQLQPGVSSGQIQAGGTQIWTYTGHAGEVLTLTTDADWDTTLSLYLNGEEIAFNDDDSGSNSRIQHTLSSDGTYQIVVAGYDRSDSGAYTLQVESK